MIFYTAPYADFQIYEDLPKVEGFNFQFVTSQGRDRSNHSANWSKAHHLPEMGSLIKARKNKWSELEDYPVEGYIFDGEDISPAVKHKHWSYENASFSYLDENNMIWKCFPDHVVFDNKLRILKIGIIKRKILSSREVMRALYLILEERIKYFNSLKTGFKMFPNKYSIKKSVMVSCGEDDFYLQRARNFSTPIYTDSWSSKHGVPVLTEIFYDRHYVGGSRHTEAMAPKMDLNSIKWSNELESWHHRIKVNIKDEEVIATWVR